MIFSPLVLNELDHSKLSFGIDGNTSRSDIEEKYKNTQLIEGKANPFNGVIFSKKMFSKISLPKSDIFSGEMKMNINNEPYRQDEI
ncbi:hypothetical protein [Enterobacter cloacae complex sp. 309I3]|uniref:hypothetical protein n=1 Tax=Enterobacter cloacae complex sp. 309I3 TaxID=3395879 RepID=UPI003CED409D